MQARIVVTMEHGEARQEPLNGLLSRFLKDLRGIGYTPAAKLHWPSVTVPAPPEPPKVPKAPASTSPPADEAHAFRHKGGGYYEIVVAGEIVDTVKGKTAAEAWSA